MVTEEQLTVAVAKFRGACERAAAAICGDSGYGCFGEFPGGQCWPASHMLAQYLVDTLGIRTADLSVHTNAWDKDQSHAWLEFGPWILDITVDQFDDPDRPGWVTTSRIWHSRFQNGSSEPFEVISSNEPLAKRYRLVMSHL